MTSLTFSAGAARVDRDHAGVAVGRQVAEHRVRQPALFADVLEEPRAHRAAENRVQHVERVPVVVRLRIGRRAETEMALLDVLLTHDAGRA